METTFNINDWLPAKTEDRRQKTEDSQLPRLPQNGHQGEQADQSDTTIEMDIDRVVAAIEKNNIDLTADYKDWITIGFALASELGEMGRSYFHRISKFYPKYNSIATDKQFDNCIKTNNNRVTIKSLFFLAKQANIMIGAPQPQKNPEDSGESGDRSQESLSGLLSSVSGPDSHRDHSFTTSALAPDIYEKLPKILNDCCQLFDEGIEKDIILLSSLAVLSACLPNIQGVYFNRTLSAHLYLFITGPSASGKGTMVWARNLAQPIHEELYAKSSIEIESFQKELSAWEKLSKTEKKEVPKPEQPFRKMMFLPANSSSAALTQLLAENNFKGIIFESEADTLSNTAKQDWGDSSDIFRKAFHHENTSMARRLNKEIIEIKNPHLAICLSGTPKQVVNLMPEVENGLFSRFMYYAFSDDRGFLNPFVSYKTVNYENFFIRKGYEVHAFFNKLNKLLNPINFNLTKEQGVIFTKHFQKLLDKNKMLLTRDLDANTKRLGVITFRIAMILTTLRLMESEIGKDLPISLICSDDDFQTALNIASSLESHAIAVYQQMPKVIAKDLRLAFYENLPDSFNRKMYLEIAKEVGIADKTADKYIKLFIGKLVDHQFNRYTKLK